MVIKMKKTNKIKKICLGVMPILALIIGFTLSYYLTNNTINNDFKSTIYGSTLIKECNAPNKWWAGDSYTCEISGRNESDIDVALRIIVYPEWTDDSNTNLNNTFSYDVYNAQTNEYDTVTEDYAQIHFINSNDWIYDGEIYIDDVWDYGKVYYYKNKLSKNQLTSLLTDQVTYNINATKSNCESINAISAPQQGSGNGNSGISGGMTGSIDPQIDNGDEQPEYIAQTYNTQCKDNDKYYGDFKLSFYIETVQYDAYQDVWETNVTIN